jgi:hypothetical protein
MRFEKVCYTFPYMHIFFLYCSYLGLQAVKNYTDLTPELLQRAYPCFQKHAKDFNYDMLRQNYWLELVSTAVNTGSIEHVLRHHPKRNMYCNFLD